jgi:hypothetical protein
MPPATSASRITRRRPLPFATPLCFLALVSGLALLSSGCKPSASHTSNPRLKQIDELINRQLPPGTPMPQVNLFLNSRGYTIETPRDAHSIVAIMEHVDTETLQPSAARVTFHFDPHDNLLSYDLTAVTPTSPH